MASTLECVGLAVEDEIGVQALIQAVGRRATPFARTGRVKLLRWEDPSGARVMIGLKGRELVDFIPSLASDPVTRLAEIRAVNAQVATAAVVDSDGDQLTSLGIELEQRALLAGEPLDAGPAAVVSLGLEVSVHADAAAFGASPASLLDPNAEHGTTPPRRVAAESFIPSGLFNAPEEVNAYAQLAGVVLHADRRTTEHTGQSFIVARVRTAGFETDTCLSAGEHATVPESGEIIAGTVLLVGSVPVLEARSGGRRWWRPAPPSPFDRH